MRFLWVVLLQGCGVSWNETGDTGDEVPTTDTAATAACDLDETPVGLFCQSALCNYCRDCQDEDQVLANVTICDPAAYVSGCCYQDTCTDPVLGDFDRISCPHDFGGDTWWFNPATRQLVSYAWSGDIADWCEGQSYSQMFGPDLTQCY